MRNLSKLEESDRYYNWYHGYTQIQIPYISSSSGSVFNDMFSGSIFYDVTTAASSGSVTTQYFGEQFDADKVETGPLYYRVNIYPPPSVRNNPNVTQHLDVEKVSLTDLSSGRDILSGLGRMETSHMTFNYTPPRNRYITISRDVIPADVMKQKLYIMPGCRVTWYYSGMEVVPEARYYIDASTRAFVRNYFNKIHFQFQ